MTLWDIPHFDGETYDPERDHDRLGMQLRAVCEFMLDGRWRTLGEISLALRRYPEASISARLRDLRKPRFGGWTVERRYAGGGIWEYRVSRGAK